MSLTISASAQNAVPGDVIVVLRNDSGVRINSTQTAGGVKSLSSVKSFEASHNVRVLETFDALSDTGNKIFMVVHSDTEDENELLRRVRNNPSVISASLNYIYTLNLPEVNKTPNDPEYHRLWGMDAINAPKAWTLGTGSEDVYVAVVDSGVDYNHPDLKDNFSHKYSRNFVGHTESGYDPSAYYDEEGHGTHCAGTIAGVGNNALGVAGVNWKAKIISLKVLSLRGGTDADIIAAYNYLARLLADNPNLNIAAVNYSVGGFHEFTPEEVIDREKTMWLVLKEISDTDRLVLCVAAGNEAVDIGAPTPSTRYDGAGYGWYKGYYEDPCSFLGISNMIAVAAVDPSLERSSFSNYSRKYVDISAPGVNIYSTVPTTYIDSNTYRYAALPTLYPYTRMSGTSMATPHVAGAATLLKSIFPKATASQVKAALLGGANGEYARDDGTSAHGLLDLTGAINFMARIMSQDMPPVISDASLPAGGVNQRYKTEFYASGSQPVTWKIDGELPDGLALDKNGQISGTPKESGTFPFTVTASNDYGTSSLALTLTISAQEAPVILRPDDGYLSGDFYVSTDVYYVDVYTKSGDWPMIWGIREGDISDDLRIIITRNGMLMFEPKKAGTFSVPVTVSNDSGSDSYTFKIAVKEAKAPEIFATKTHPLYMGRSTNMLYDDTEKAISAQRITASAYGSKPISWNVKGLPKGVSFDVVKGGGSLSNNEAIHREDIALNGRPEESGDFRVIVTVSNPYGTDSTSFDLHVSDDVPHFLNDVSNVRLLQKDTEFSSSFPLRGSAPIKFTVSGDLPDNTQITSEDNILRFYGNPTKIGHYHFTVIAENACGKDETGGTFDIYVIEPTTITTHKLPDAVAGVSYDTKISLRSDVSMSWTVSADKSLNLEISQSGVITGKPEKAGHFIVSVTAKSPDVSASVSANCPLIVRELPVIKTSSLPSGKVSNVYTSTTLSADGTAPVTWSVSEGKLPGGLTLSQNGHLYGTPKESGPFVFTVKAQNKAGHDAKIFTLDIASAGGSTPAKPESPDVAPEKSPDITPKPASPDKPAPKEIVITVGSERGLSSLTIGELASISSSGGMIAAIIPEIRTNDSAFYTPESIDCFGNVKISADVPTGWTLVWNPFKRDVADALSVKDAEDDNVQFTDSDGKITLTVPENHIVNVSAWLDADTTYAPVISAVAVHEDMEGISSSSGGCNAGMLGLVIFVPVIAAIRRKR